jgi:hypothetical protein
MKPPKAQGPPLERSGKRTDKAPRELKPGRSSLERGPPRVGPPKGQAVAPKPGSRQSLR